MSLDTLDLPSARPVSSPGHSTMAWQRFCTDRVGVVCAVVVVAYLIVALCAGVGFIAADWSRETGVSYAAPEFTARAGSAVPAGIRL